MELYSTKASDPKANAQRNLQGRTHYVDDDTLRFHKSRVISARSVDNGLLFAIVTSDALDYQNTRRGFRYVVFDLFGTVVGRTEAKQARRRSEQATKDMWDFLNGFDAVGHTGEAIKRQRERQLAELAELEATVARLAAAAA